MTPVLDKLTELQASVLSTMDDLQAPTVNTVKRVTDTVDRVTPDVKVPRTAVLPTLGDLVDNQFTFVIEVLKRQRKTAKAVVKASAPVTDRLNPGAGSSPKVTRVAAA